MTLAWDAFRRPYPCPPPRSSSLTRRPKSLSPQQPESARPFANTMGVISISSPTEGGKETCGKLEVPAQLRRVCRAGRGPEHLPPAMLVRPLSVHYCSWGVCTPRVANQTMTPGARTVSDTTPVVQQCVSVPAHRKDSVSVQGGQGASADGTIGTRYQNSFVLELGVWLK